MRLTYRSGYKHQVYSAWQTITPIVGHSAKVPGYIMLDASGLLSIESCYAWDGATGAIDTANFMRGSLAHDALYQLMREGLLPLECRKAADDLLISLCKEDGMWPIRRAYVMAAVRAFGGIAVKAERPVKYSPSI